MKSETLAAIKRVLAARDTEIEIQAYGGNSQRNLRMLDKAHDETGMAVYALKQLLREEERLIKADRDHAHYLGGSGHGGTIVV